MGGAGARDPDVIKTSGTELRAVDAISRRTRGWTPRGSRTTRTGAWRKVATASRCSERPAKAPLSASRIASAPSRLCSRRASRRRGCCPASRPVRPMTRSRRRASRWTPACTGCCSRRPGISATYPTTGCSLGSRACCEMVGNARNVFLYHIPSMTGVPLSVNLIGRLKTAFPGVVVGVKDCIRRLAEYREAARRAWRPADPGRR